MNCEDFIKEFFDYLKNNDKKCLKFIENNKELVKDNFKKESDPVFIKEFIKKINYTILQNKNNFELFENVLKSDSFEYVYSVFKNSDILIEACKNDHRSAVDWLITTMDINPYVQDKMGRSALMYAVKRDLLLNVVDKYGKDYQCIMLEDHEGNNALYYAIGNRYALSHLLEKVDINHLNHHHETVLMYCCKKDVSDAIKPLLDCKEVDINIPDQVGKTVPMVLIENLRFNELEYLGDKKCNFNIIYENSEKILSTLIQQMYRKNQPLEAYTTFAKKIIYLTRTHIDFNVVVDENRNTALMVFLLARDYDTFNFICRHVRNLDLATKNRYGENVTSLYLKFDITPDPETAIINQGTFDFYYKDPQNRNTTLMLSIINKPMNVSDIIFNHNYCSIFEVNLHQENALIIAAKFDNYSAIELLLQKEFIKINHQDDTGNTALHYAVHVQNIPMIYDLIDHGANPHLKNNENESALDVAQSLDHKKILDTINGNLPHFDYLKEKSSLEERGSINESRGVRIPQTDEYLHTRMSNFYSEFLDDTRKQQMKRVYEKHLYY